MRIYIKDKNTKQPKDLKESEILLNTIETEDIVIGKDVIILSIKHNNVDKIAIRNEDILTLAIKIIAKHNN